MVAYGKRGKFFDDRFGPSLLRCPHEPGRKYIRNSIYPSDFIFTTAGGVFTHGDAHPPEFKYQWGARSLRFDNKRIRLVFLPHLIGTSFQIGEFQTFL